MKQQIKMKHEIEYQDLEKRVLQIKKLNEECEEWGYRGMNTWLMEGCPDGADDEEIREYVSDEETYKEWIRVYNIIADYVNGKGRR